MERHVGAHYRPLICLVTGGGWLKSHARQTQVQVQITELRRTKASAQLMVMEMLPAQTPPCTTPVGHVSVPGHSTAWPAKQESRQVCDVLPVSHLAVG